jgi:uncharacterized membrane protein (DUF2068 family)
VAVGAHHLLHRDVAHFVATWVAQLHLDPDNRYIGKYIGKALARVLSLDARQLRAIGAGTLVYAALLMTEGIGLLLRRRWAEYFTVIVTGSFIPIEVYELTRRLTWARLVLLGVNVVVVWYLIALLRRPESKERVRS